MNDNYSDPYYSHRLRRGLNMPDIEEYQPTGHNLTDLGQLNPHSKAPQMESLDGTLHSHQNPTESPSISNESSPTTTISTMDDSSATEPSPGSSPESPPPATFAYGMLRPRTADASTSGFFELQKQPPPRKGRNLKNLAVNTSRTTGRAHSASALTAQVSAVPDISTITSPTFVKPLSPPKRKPTSLGLTLLTPVNNRAVPQEIRLSIPPTPTFSRPGMLRHFQSSPSLPLFPGLGSEAVRNMHKPTLKHNLKILSPIISPIVPSRTINSPEEEEEEEQNFDIPLSREEKPEAYPNGPICVYEPFIDLYAEPTAEQCRAYDVIFNVASEVRNPLVSNPESQPAEMEIRIDGGGGIQYAPKRLLISETVNGSMTEETSPTTPKATPLNTKFPDAELFKPKDPEYIHIPWEHNTDIVPDLLRLVKLLDDFVTQRKRALVHCQCGVSRSASLVVAYGLYKDPTMSVQEAYDAVKKKSKWIGPNMNLIMQLQEFRTSLTRGGILSCNRGFSPVTPSSAFSEWNHAFGEEAQRHMIPELISPSKMQNVQMADADVDAISPGPSSAPSGRPWSLDMVSAPIQIQHTRAVSAVKSDTVEPAQPAFVDPAGHLVPILEVSNGQSHKEDHPADQSSDPESVTPTEAISSPRSSEFAMTALQPPREMTGSDSFGLMSPTSTCFPNPFDRSALLASLGMGSVHDAGSSRARAISLHSQQRPTMPSFPPPPPPPVTKPRSGLMPHAFPRLRGKISSPSLREQKHLQSLQVQIENKLHTQQRPQTSYSGDMDGALMSPRATEFTKNPFALAPATLSLTVPEQKSTSQVVASDPRSPAQPGASPIIRNIMDFL